MLKDSFPQCFPQHSYFLFSSSNTAATCLTFCSHAAPVWLGDCIGLCNSH